HFRIPSSVTHIGNWAFWQCERLTSIELPSSVTHIGDRAFSWCSSLTSIVLPSSVTHIGNDVFGRDQWNVRAPISSIYVPKGTKGKFMKLLPSEFHDKIIER
ncbi:MAG: leucine-rich repeat domain-containing protein, partial [Muribaculaceae bacterium]|nr:leucine-rich repeat domain-containing protein [Muribaculaceae bacterium]